MAAATVLLEQLFLVVFFLWLLHTAAGGLL
jgi:hypothetical protein